VPGTPARKQFSFFCYIFVCDGQARALALISTLSLTFKLLHSSQVSCRKRQRVTVSQAGLSYCSSWVEECAYKLQLNNITDDKDLLDHGSFPPCVAVASCLGREARVLLISRTNSLHKPVQPAAQCPGCCQF
jgi:hypothetical protein